MNRPLTIEEEKEIAAFIETRPKDEDGWYIEIHKNRFLSVIHPLSFLDLIREEK